MLNRLGSALLLSAVAFSGCDNVGRAFDPNVGGGGGGGGANDGTGIVAVPVGGTTESGRPSVVDAFPKGSGWAPSVPIVVVFDESIRRDSVTPDGADPRIYIRAEGTEQALPGAVQFLLGNTVAIVLPAAGLSGDVTYEVIVESEVADVDGVRKGGTEPEVAATFTPDADTTTQLDGQVVTTLPIDNERSARRTTEILAIFDRAAEAATLNTSNFSVVANASPIAGSVDYPIGAGPATDSRIARFTPDANLASSTEHQIRFNASLLFAGGGVLDFRGRDPFATFTTIGPAPPTGVAVGNITAGFPDQINRANVSNVQIDVAVDASVAAGDRITARIYGGEGSTQAEGDVDFVERTVDVPSIGPTTVTVAFETDLGSLESPRFEEGGLTIMARVERGSDATSFVRTTNNTEPGFDITPPTVQSFLPTQAGSTDIVTDQESVAVFGLASEPVGSGELTANGVTKQLFGSATNGNFVFEPIPLGQRTSAVDYTLSLTDAAGNSIAMPVSGQILQRGAITGTARTALTVEVYDDSTLSLISGATVIVDPGLPTKPASGARRTANTGVGGRATFTGLATGTRTVTVVLDGYHLTTLLATGASFVSIPIRPTTGGTGTLDGNFVFQPGPGETALIGSNLLLNPENEEISTTTAAATTIPETTVRAGRPMILTGFSGAFEPGGVPTFSGFACEMCGADGTTSTAGQAPIVPGETATANMVALPTTGTAAGLAAPYTLDFATAAGLGDLDGNPTVRAVAGLRGFAGMGLFGVGFATPTSGKAFSVNSNHALSAIVSLLAFEPALWISTEARDAAGNVSRQRRLVTNATLGTTFDTTVPQGIPTLSSAATSTGAPVITYFDRQDATTLLAGIAITTIQIVDSNNREWRLLWNDTDGAVGNRNVQVPVLTGGLATGAWEVRVFNEMFVSTTMFADNLMITEKDRSQVTFAASAAQTITVN